jgi:two-component system sensor histidine kinase QseC
MAHESGRVTALRSLQGRLLAWVLGALTVVWMGAAIATWIDARHELDELLDSHLAQAASLLVAQQSHEIHEDDDRFDVPLLHRYAPRVAFQVWHEGRLAVRSTNAPALPMARVERGFETLVIGSTSWRVFAAHGGEADVQVYVGEQTESRAAILRAVMRSTLWPLPIALPLLGLVAWWGVRRGLAPLRRLGAAVARREPQALEPIAFDEKGPAEMLPLVAALNRLFERIGRLLESERRFTADAAHELRTPIAAIRAQAEVALGAGQDAPRRHALQATLQGCDRATHLVEQLLTLSRLEAASAASTGAVDLSDVTRQVVAEIAPQALLRRQTIELDAPAVCRLKGDAALLGVLVRNLVDNAVRYSPPEATVNVAVRGAQGRVVVSVEDGGPGMDEAQRARLGERFFRVLGSGQRGSGLGWSIVRRVAAVHGAQIDIGTSTTLSGLSVQVSFAEQPSLRDALPRH